ncbi:multivesicular body subunit 12A isoform X2 [Hyla sarda]|uniref:multivesicular body subunit 12A isoform X2 n=1 Tax=Hyla sarda TaxID=327740 RepID=UPI0024C42CFF|nr:multivesicular body subunit 12A isoform X2 [Hyla sarda]
MEENSTPLTSLAWTSGQSTCPKGHIIIAATAEGASANFLKGFNQRSALYLCYSSTPETIEQVITEVLLLSDKNALPVGFAFIGEYVDPKVTVPKKKRLCVKLSPVNTADSAVADIKLTVKSKHLAAPYTRIGDMSGLALWCKKVPVSVQKPTPKPRNITSGIRGLSFDNGTPPQTNSLHIPAPVAAKPNVRSPQSEHPIHESNVYGVSAIDGIPFTIHPMFESKISEPSINFSNFRDLKIKTLAEIENEVKLFLRSYGPFIPSPITLKSLL